MDVRWFPSPDTPLRNLRLVVADLETTGFHPRDGDEIIAIGAVVIENRKLCPDRVFDRLVNPGRPIPPHITKLTGICEECVSGKSGVVPALRDFLSFLGGDCLAGHYIGFDLDFVNYKLEQLYGLRLKNPVFDTWAIARRLYPTLGSHSLDALLHIHGIDAVGRHSALGDARLTAQLLLRLFTILETRQIYTVGQLSEFLEHKVDYEIVFPVV
ncbi:MAG: 3'-5' exonuclease [Peptococcaceae bacterium]|nr:3'-5' exonuclease [Peptococcaceae bacterium]